MTLPRFDFSKNQNLEGCPATSATREGRRGNVSGNVADVATVAAGLPENRKFADLTDFYFEFEERAAIIAEGCGISQEEGDRVCFGVE
jgi:hypothetical protein